MKNTFASKTFAAWTFASGTWAGVGVEITFVGAPVCRLVTVEAENRIVTVEAENRIVEVSCP